MLEWVLKIRRGVQAPPAKWLIHAKRGGALMYPHSLDMVFEKQPARVQLQQQALLRQEASASQGAANISILKFSVIRTSQTPQHGNTELSGGSRNFH